MAKFKQGRSQRDVMDYMPPQGPTNVADPRGPGLHGVNYGNCGTQGPKSLMQDEVGKVGLGGDAKRKQGSQR